MCCYPSPQEREAVEGHHRWRGRPKRGTAIIEIPGPRVLATMERIPPKKPHRDKDALCEPKVREAKLLGQRLMARDFDRQVAELQVRIAVLNRYTALGIPVTEAVG